METDRPQQEDTMQTLITWMIGAALGLGPIAYAQQTATDQSSHNTIMRKTLLTQALKAKIDGKESQVIMLELTYPPGNSTPPHHHTGSVFVYVLEGALESQVEGQPLKIYQQGETFFEPIGATHLVSGNANADKPTKFLAIFFTEKRKQPLTIMGK
jgi:quercetin dioxygenase-like cupin family protein